jgi:hypothetical protein
MKPTLVAIGFLLLVSCNLREVNYSDDEINSIKLSIINSRYAKTQ